MSDDYENLKNKIIQKPCNDENKSSSISNQKSKTLPISTPTDIANITKKKSTPTLKNPCKPLKKWFSGSIRYSNSLRGVIKGEDKSAKETLNFSLNINPYSYWFLGVTFAKPINGYSNDDYNPDFSYSFGYRDWHNDTFSLVYSNYQNNKLFPKGDESRFNFKEGVWNLSYKNKYKDVKYTLGGTYKASDKQKRLYLKLSKKFLDNSLLVSFNATKDFTNKDTRASLGFKYVSDNNFFLTTKLYYYSDVEYQEDHEGDYAFSFGYKFDKPKLTLQYSNYYSKTRYPWRKDGKGDDFIDGKISINWNFSF